MDSDVSVSISESLRMVIKEASGGHTVTISENAGQDIAELEVNDLHRLLKRPGTVVASAPVELRNDQRQIVVRLRGRVIGQVEKHQIVSAL